MIRVCPYCSNINVDKLKKTIGEENVKTGCIGACRSFSKEAVGKINGELVIKQTEDEFLEVYEIDIKEAYNMIMSNEICDSKTVIGLLLTKELI